MVNEQTKRRFKKIFRKRKKNAAEIGRQADESIQKFLIGRYERLISVRRFVFLWTGLFVLLFFVTVMQLRGLGPYYQELRPVAGGIYSEGVVGKFTNANPLYATSSADATVSRLVFSGLLKYDNNNQLVGDLAKNWSLSSTQTRYTFHLRHNVTWHDGQPFTANDVVFTYHMIQNPEAQSSLYANWQGIKVSAKDNYTVNFDLPNPLSSFPYSLTNGIIPAHVFKNTQPIQMRSAQFNSNPIGTGPFEWKFVEVTGKNSATMQQRITLAAFNNYWAGRPKLDGFNITTFSDEQHLSTAFNKKQLNAMDGLDTITDSLQSDSSVHIYTTPLNSEVMAFFNNSNPALGDVSVRRALVSGVDRGQVTSQLQYPVILADEPLLASQLGYDKTAAQAAYNKTGANQILDQDGWVNSGNSTRSKANQHLEFTMAAEDTPEYSQVAQSLQKQWSQLGIKVNVHYYSADDMQKVIIANHDYDILLYGINIGVDPDVFAYWDSSQASLSSQGHLNLSEYKSKTADQALEGARTRADPAQRITKYKIFLTTWATDAPALALYQPNFLYVSRGQVFNYDSKQINSSTDRFTNVSQWMIRQRRQSL